MLFKLRILSKTTIIGVFVTALNPSTDKRSNSLFSNFRIRVLNLETLDFIKRLKLVTLAFLLPHKSKV